MIEIKVLKSKYTSTATLCMYDKCAVISKADRSDEKIVEFAGEIVYSWVKAGIQLGSKIDCVCPGDCDEIGRVLVDEHGNVSTDMPLMHGGLAANTSHDDHELLKPWIDALSLTGKPKRTNQDYDTSEEIIWGGFPCRCVIVKEKSPSNTKDKPAPELLSGQRGKKTAQDEVGFLLANMRGALEAGSKYNELPGETQLLLGSILHHTVLLSVCGDSIKPQCADSIKSLAAKL